MLTLRCFGSAAVHDDATAEDLPLRSRKHLGLLLYLACHPKTLHTREELAVLLWDDTGSRERHSLSQALYDIRSKLGPVLEADTTTVQFRPDRLRCEAQQFEDAVERRDHETALELFRGEFAPNLIHLGSESFDRWLDGERERHRVLAILALRNAQKAAEERGDWDHSCLAALRLIRLNDFDEKSHRALMRGLWMKGDAASALAHYKALKKRWPSNEARGLAPKTEALFHALKEGKSSTELSMSAHSLGRARELKQLSQALAGTASGQNRHVLVYGEPGSGKSTILHTFSRLCLAKGVEAITVDSTLSAIACMPSQECPSLRPSDSLTNSLPLEELSRLTSITKGERPAVLVIDDLWHLGEAPADLLTSIVKGSRNPHLVIIATIDSVEQNLYGPRTELASYLSSPDARRVELGPLDRLHLEEIIQTRVRGLSSMHRTQAATLAGGNPSYALKLARLLKECGDNEAKQFLLPEECLATPAAHPLCAALARRLEPLEDDARRVLSYMAVSVSGLHEIAMERLSRSLTRPLSAHLKSLEKLKLIAEKGGVWHLRHPIIRQYLISELTTLERAAMHISVASALDNRTREGALAAARHLAAAGEAGGAFDNAMAAASIAAEEGAFLEVVDAAQLAESVATTTRQLAQARLAEGLAHLRAGRLADAELLFSHLTLTGDLRQHARQEVIAGQAEVAILKADWGRAKGLLKRLDTDASPKTAIQVALLRLRLAIGESDLGILSQAAAELASLLETVGRPRSDLTRLWFDAWKGLLQFRLSYESIASADELFSRFGGELQSTGSAYELDILQARGVLLIRQGALSEAQRLLARAMAKTDANQPSVITSNLLNNYAVTQLEGGDFTNANALFDRAIAIDTALGVRSADSAMPILNKATCLLYAGSTREARDLFRKAQADTRALGVATLSRESAACLALLALLEGDSDPARALTEEVGNALTHPRWDGDWFKVVWATGFILALRDRKAARAYFETAASQEANFDVISSLKLRVLARLAETGGSGDTRGKDLSGAETRAVYTDLAWFRRSAARWWRTSAASVQA